MGALDYETYEEAVRKYRPEERWKVFDGTPDNFNIAYECIDRHKGKGLAVGIKFSDGHSEEYTFDELSKFSSQFANMLEDLGINKGDRIAIAVDVSFEFYISLFGSIKAGCIPFVCSPLYGPEAIEYRIKSANPSSIIIPEDQANIINLSSVPHIIYSEDLKSLIKGEKINYKTSTSANDPAMIQFTSGTTGLPKQVVYHHKSLVTFIPVSKWFQAVKDGTRLFCSSSPAWGHGMWHGTLGPLALGAFISTRSGKFDPELTLEALGEFKINNMTGVATAYRKLIATGKVKEKIKEYDIKLEVITYTGEPMETELIYKIKEEFGVWPYGGYGSTEFGPICHNFPAFKDFVFKPGSLGKPMPGTEVAILDENGKVLPPNQVGEIAIKIKGKWIKVGDLGMMDEDGYFWYKGRADDVIKSSGYRIGPEEVESVLNMHEAVLESAVIGVTDEKRGQVVMAFIKLKPGFTPNEELKKDIQNFTRRKLSAYAYPRIIEFIDELPKTPEGKIKRKDLRKLVGLNG
ncbi:MAG: AMP-binding protein [Candidatus Bathyarchaeia archaeon]